ncbi:MAG TPA: FAD-dependent oxidoreductase [Nitrospirota bacterium]
MADGVVILGAGLAGLSAAWHIGKGCEVFEAQDAAGGLCRTRELGGFRFDYTGHLLHLKDPYARKLVLGLMKGNLAEHERKAAIFAYGGFTGYPYQANTYGLPEDAARECVQGFINAPGRKPGGARPGNFRDWIKWNFGSGISDQFMLPYNGKLWQYPLEEMAVEAIEPYVPVPTVEDIERGATFDGAKGLGYNPRFYYPERGGIGSLVQAFLPGVDWVSVGQRAVEICAGRRTVKFATGYSAWYDSLVNTMPLAELLDIITDAPGELKEAAAKLRYTSVYDISLGVAREEISPYHWIYFPGGEFSFYRAGILSNFASDMAPKGSSGLYVEVSHRPESVIPEEELVEKSISGLVSAGVLREDDEIPVRDVSDIKYAYVVMDAHSMKAVPAIHGWLHEKGIHSIGRYGAWEYSSMEDAILEGRAVSERVK